MPARVNTLTSTTEMPIGRVRSNDARASGPTTPARAASAAMTTMIAMGPR